MTPKNSEVDRRIALPNPAAESCAGTTIAADAPADARQTHAPKRALRRVQSATSFEIARDTGRPRNDLWEVAVWKNSIAVRGREIFLTYQVDNEAIVVPENVDAIRALTAIETRSRRSP